MSLPGSHRAAWALPLAIVAVTILVVVTSLRPAEGATTLTVCAAGPPGCTYTTIQAALDDIPNLAPDTEYVLELAAETYTENITVNVDASVQLVGVPGGATVLDGGGAGRVIDLQNAGGSQLVLRDMTITGGNAAGDGGGIRNGATLELYGVIMWTNTASNRGGAIHSPSGTSLTIVDAALAGNTAGLAGSSMQANGTLSVTRALIDGETIDRQGAASGTATITDSAIVNGGRVSANSVVTVSSSWWGVSTGPTGATLDGVAASTSHITGLTVTPSNATPTTGTPVDLTVVPALLLTPPGEPPGPGTYHGPLTATVTRTGENPGSSTATGEDTATTSYTGANAGADTVTATVLFAGQAGGAGALTGTSTVTWLAAPVADAGGPYTANEGSAITFDGTGSTSAVGGETYLWDFGGGATSTDATTSHTYADNGTFSPTLTVTDANGNDNATASVTISNVAPSVSAGGDVSMTLGQTASLAPTFTDPGGSDAPWTYTVDWGGGSGPSAPGSAGTPGVPFNLSHTYGAAGNYTATVCVQDKDSGNGCDTVAVTVSAPPPPPPPPPPPATTATPTVTPIPSPTPTPSATPSATPTSTPSPVPTASPVRTALPSPSPTPSSTPLATSTPSATPEPTAAATSVAAPTSTPPDATPPASGGGPAGAPPSGGGGAPTSPGASPSPVSNEGGPGSGQQAVMPMSVAPGQRPASLLQSVDTSTTRGGRPVPPAEAETRAQIRNIATAGAGFSGGVVPWYASQSIDERAVAGALVSGGAFLPLMFGSGPGGGSGGGSGAPAGPGGGAPGDSSRSADRGDARRDDDSAGADEGDDDVAAT